MCFGIYSIHFAVDVFGGQSFGLCYCIEAPVFLACGLRFTIHLAVDVFSGQSVGLWVCIGALIFLCFFWDTLYTFSCWCFQCSIRRLAFLYRGSYVFCVCFGIHYTFSCTGACWSISRLACLYRVSCVFVCVLRYTLHSSMCVFGGQSVGLRYCIGSLVLLVCVLGYSSMHYALGVFGGQSVGSHCV